MYGIRILFVFGRIVASIIRIRPNTTHPLFGTARIGTNSAQIHKKYSRVQEFIKRGKTQEVGFMDC